LRFDHCGNPFWRFHEVSGPGSGGRSHDLGSLPIDFKVFPHSRFSMNAG
jgi:hypothetical protein